MRSLGKIGTGGMADVYKAKDHTAEPLCSSEGVETGIPRRYDIYHVNSVVEAQAAAGLTHPNIVNVL